MDERRQSECSAGLTPENPGHYVILYQTALIGVVLNAIYDEL